jgi:ATP/maltotriose-dependent transcriptional regulator MalT
MIDSRTKEGFAARFPYETAELDPDLRLPDLLTPREQEVAALVARGYSNRGIAQELVISGSTAERHVANIFAKLHMRRRTEVALWAVEYGLIRPLDGGHKWLSSEPIGTPLEESGPINIPAELSSFIGRERELSELLALLPTVRLLTLTGPGGIGKTRLAVRLVGAAAVRGNPR